MILITQVDEPVPMSLPRRAMEQMGMSLCCLACDASDVAGLPRCKTCMDSHAKARDKLTVGKATTKAQRLARELVTMIAEPSNYTNDDDHGKWMERYSSLINDHEYDPSTKQLRRTVSRARTSRKSSIIRDVANQNKWADSPPDQDEIEEFKATFGGMSNERPMSWDDLIAEIEGMLEE